MGQRKRSEDGRYPETVTSERVLDALEATADPVATAGDVADVLGCTREAARVKLADLHEEGRINRRKVGGAAVIWWLTEDAGDEDSEDPPAAPLYGLVGLVDEDGAARVRECSRAVRESINEEVEQTQTELSDPT